MSSTTARSISSGTSSAAVQSTAVAGSHWLAAAAAYSRGAMSAQTWSRSVHSAPMGGPPASTSAPRAARPQRGSARSSGGPSAAPALFALRQRCSPAVPLMISTGPPGPVVSWPSALTSVTRWPCSRHQAARWTRSAGWLPVTVSRPPGGSAASARSTSRCPPSSRPRPSRSVVARTDGALGVVEAGLVDGALELRVALQARRQPLFEPFQVQQRAQVLVAVVHAEQQLAKALGQRVVGGRPRGHRAMVVRRRLREDPDRAGRQDALPAEQQQVRVDHAGRVYRVGAEQGAGRVALAADMVAVQPDADVEKADGHVAGAL